MFEIEIDWHNVPTICLHTVYFEFKIFIKAYLFTEHLKTVFGMSPSLSPVSNDCFVCDTVSITPSHLQTPKHMNMRKLLKFYLDFCFIYKWNPFKLAQSSTYIFCIKLMLTKPFLRSIDLSGRILFIWGFSSGSD